MLIDEYRGHLPVKRMCELMKVSKTAYYSWSLKIPRIDDSFYEGELSKKIEDIVLEFPGYGYRRVTAELKRRGRLVNHKKVFSIMRLRNLTKKRRRRYVLTTDSTHSLPIYSNLAKKITPLRD